jgi:hypothetical protein
MPPSSTAPKPPSSPLAAELRTLGSIIREHRLAYGLDLLDAADYSDVDVAELSRIEDGNPASTCSSCDATKLAMRSRPRDTP